MNWWLIRRRRINAQPPAVLTGATWAIDGDGRAYNTPTLGSELLANGDFSAWTGDNPTEWTIGSEAAPDTEITQRGSGQAHSGSGTGSANFFSSTGAGVYAFQSPVATVGRWYVVAATVSVIGAGNVGWRWGFTSPLAMQMFTTTNYAVTARSLSSQFTIIRSGGAFDVTIDGISLKQLTTANLFAYTQDIDYPTGPPTVRINTMVTGTQAGVIGWVDDPGNPQNGISAICNGGGSIDLIKLVAGTYTQLQSISSAHVADAP
ncbi:MAG: hypothetical protein KDE53_12390, partial [Caldilineaceae bacterium]|nr:hypothetical protein [Caldilineaceae bacterium]